MERSGAGFSNGWLAERGVAVLVSASVGLLRVTDRVLCRGGVMIAVMKVLVLARPFHRGPACLGRLLRRGAGGATYGPRGREASRGAGDKEVAALLLGVGDRFHGLLRKLVPAARLATAGGLGWVAATETSVARRGEELLRFCATRIPGLVRSSETRV